MGSSFLCIMFMRVLFFVSLSQLFVLTHSSPSIQPLCHVDESSALLQFKNSFSIKGSESSDPLACPKVASWTLEGQNSNCCAWDGVICDDTGHVIELDLSSCNLYGSINSNSSLFHLVHLQSLNLAFNNFNYSQIPSQVGNLSRLTYLNLSSSMLSGEIPFTLMNLTKLTFLGLSSNNFQGPIPSSIVHLYNLEVLDVYNNNLNGTMDLCMFLNMKSLGMLDLSHNELSLLIDETCTNATLPKFYGLDLAACNLSEFPNFLRNQDGLQWLSLAYNNIAGHIPEWMWHIMLNLQKNKLEGSIPQTWAKGTQLRMINFSENKFQNRLPTSLANLMMLEAIDLGVNQFNDSFPYWFGNLPNLMVLCIRSNKFNGPIVIPNAEYKFPNLRVLDLSNNSFSGKLPLEIFQNWKYRDFENESPLTYIHVKTNFTIPKGSWNYHLSYDYNYSMEITNKGMNMVYQRVLELFRGIDMSSNRFEGEILESIGDLKVLHLFNVSNNFLSSNIPFSLGNLAGLESLDLSLNKLSGEIPQQLAQLNFLQYFNVSYNNLTGHIPNGQQFNTFQNNSFEGNSGLCGSPLTNNCDNFDTLLPPASISENSEDSDSPFEFGWKIVVIGYGFGTVAGVIIGHVVTARNPDWLRKTFGMKQLGRRHRN
ncbi:hypothetical protein ACB094_01G354500 [Castanea mollissima]